MRLHQLCAFLLAGLLLAACKVGDNNSFTVDARVSNMPEQKVELRALSMFEPIEVVDSATSDAEGHFTLKGTALEPGLYQLFFHADTTRLLLLSLDKGKATVTADWSALNESFDVTGSPASSSLRTLMMVMREHAKDFRSFQIVKDSMMRSGRDSLVGRVDAELELDNLQLTNYIKRYADTSKYLPNVLFAARVLNPMAEEAYLNTLIAGFDKRFPGSETAQTFAGKYREAMQRMVPDNRSGNAGTASGTPARDISQPGPDGKTVSLSSLRGKYVLVDFWASWCPPCRAENPNVVAAYNKYKGRNFTVFGVSLDSKKESWLEAIREDGLAWTQVSDLQKWDNAAAQEYGISSIPSNFLVDPQGNIIAQDLHGPALQAKLEEVLPR